MSNKSIDRVLIVVINYRAIDDTLACIRSLTEQTYANFHILIVENGSRDNSVEVLKEFEKAVGKTGNISILYNEKNLGFTGGANSGFEWGKGKNFKYIAFLNNDATADKNWLKALVLAIEKDRHYGSATGLLLKDGGKKIDSTAEQYSIWGLAFPTNRNQKVEDAPRKQRLIFGATGGATLHRMEMLEQLGAFYEPYFAYYEDIDLSFRMQLSGWKITYTPNALAYHAVGATSKKMPGFTTQQTFRNLPLLFIRNVPKELLYKIGWRFIIAYTLMLLKAIFRGGAKPAIKGWLKGIGLFWTVGIPSRHNVQVTKKVPTNYITNILWPDLPPEQSGLRKFRRLFTGK